MQRGKHWKISGVITILAMLFLWIVIVCGMDENVLKISKAAVNYPDSMVADMQKLFEKDYFLLDVSNMRQQENGEGPVWGSASTLYYYNVTKGSSWKETTGSKAEGLTEEEKRIVKELRQSNIYCFHLTDADTDNIQLGYTNDNSVNNGNYYRSNIYQAGELKGHLYAYQSSYTVKSGTNAGKKGYLIGKVTLPKITGALQTEQQENNTKDVSIEEEKINSSSYSSETAKLIRELWGIDEDYFLLDTTGMNLSGGPDWSSADKLYINPLVSGSANWTTYLTSGSTTRETEILTALASENIRCWKIGSSYSDSDSVLMSYSNVRSTANGNDYYKTANYTVGEFRGGFFAYSGTCTIDSKKGYTIASVELPKSPMAGKTVYFDAGKSLSSLPKIIMIDEDGTTTKASMKLAYGKSHVYQYTFPSDLAEGVGCRFQYSTDGSVKPDTAFTEFDSDKPMYSLSDDTWKSFSVKNGKIKIFVKHSFTTSGKGAVACFTKDGTDTGSTTDIGTGMGAFIFDLASDSYDGVYIKQNNDTNVANTTENITLAQIQQAATEYGSPLMITLSGYSAGNKRTVTFSGYVSLGDQSLDIPVGTFTKEDDVLYVNSTFYDYYSDYALQGKNRKELSGSMGANGSDNKWQCKVFNSAIEEYFTDTTLASSAWQSPLYLGEFYGTSPSLLNFKFSNNNASDNGGARLGLVNDTLVNDSVVMGTDNVKAPYFNESFLRGDNSTLDNLGYVYKNVPFPFKKNSDGYWEFNSYDFSQTLRMKQTKDGQYFLACVGSSNSVHGHTSSATTEKSNFFPFNDHTESGDPIKLNYGFGARIDIPFYMTADGKVQIDADTEKDITFSFSGDDDIWIFIDGKLVLDIGGDHGAVDGSINFATCKATTTGARLKSGTSSTSEKGTFVTTFDRLNSTEQHTLSLFYMERGLWESNMKITFNFPQSNNLSVEKAVVVPDTVNSVFKSAVDKLTQSTNGVSFPISIKNMVTSGTKFDVEAASKSIEKTFDEITSKSSVENYGKSKATSQLITSNIPGSSDRTCVLQYYCSGQKGYKDGQDVTDARSILINYPESSQGLTLEEEEQTCLKESGYVEFDVYLDATTGGGSPFLALVDGNGNRIGAWTVEAVYSGTNGNMSAGKWVTMKMYLSKFKALDSGNFDYSTIKQIQFAYWESKNVYIDNISIKAPPVYTSNGGFEKEQSKIPDYGSIGATVDDYQLMPADGAEYGLTGSTEKSYVDGGKIYLKHGENALFSDQFRRKSYLSITEECDTDVFQVKWSISEDGEVVKSGTGTQVEDGRTAQNTSPAGIKKPGENTMLFRTWDDTANSTKFYDLGVKFTNTLKTGSLKIRKQVTNTKYDQIDQNALIDVEIPYTIKVSFSNIAGLALERDSDDYETDYSVSINESVYLKEGYEVVTIEGIPAGTEYRIEEIQVADDSFPLLATGLTRDDFVLDTIEGSDPDAYFDEESKSYRGTIVADTEAEVKVVNDINPVTDETNMAGEKKWTLVEEEQSKYGNTKLETAPEGKRVTLKLQRRFVNGTGDDGITYGYEDVTSDGTTPITITLQPKKTTESSTKCFNYYYKSASDGNGGEVLSYQTDVTVKTDGWKYAVEGLPLYGMVTGRSEEGSNIEGNKGRRRKYEYRFVETQIVVADGTEERIIPVDFSEDAGYQQNSSGFAASGGTIHTDTVDGTGVIDYDITNVYDPATDLEITKVTGEDNHPMDGVTFELVRLVEDDNGNLVEDTTFNKNTGSRVGTTGDGTGKLTFNNLPDGTYRLTEVKTVAGYSLLAKPIDLIINHGEGTTVEGNQYPLDATGKVIQITISNQGLLDLPMTGSRGRYIIIACGVLLTIGGETFYLWNMYHKNRIRHRNRKR